MNVSFLESVILEPKFFFFLLSLSFQGEESKQKEKEREKKRERKKERRRERERKREEERKKEREKKRERRGRPGHVLSILLTRETRKEKNHLLLRPTAATFDPTTPIFLSLSLSLDRFFSDFFKVCS